MFFMVEVLPLGLSCGGVLWLWRRDAASLWALDVTVFSLMYVLTMLGVELGLHRMVAHRQFRASQPVRALLAVLGCMAGQGSPLLWAAVHRQHHGHSDRTGDPHSPVVARDGTWGRVRGVLWAQFLWYGELPGLLRFRAALQQRLRGNTHDDKTQQARFVTLVGDWLSDATLVRVSLGYAGWFVVGLVLPALMGLAVAGANGALHGLVWGGFVRQFAVKQAVYAVNSIGHTIGTRPQAAHDSSRNNVVLAVLTLGSGWHNNHHAFPNAASLRLRWWQIDPCGILLIVLEKLGAIDAVKRAPSRSDR